MFLIGAAAIVTPIPDLPAKEKLYLDTLARIIAERNAMKTSISHQISTPEKEDAKESAYKRQKPPWKDLWKKFEWK